MTDIEIFRKINQIEKEIISNSLLRISSEFITTFKGFEELLYILINKRSSFTNYPTIYLLSEELEDIFKIFNTYPNISSGGLYFGLIKKGNFLLSLEGAEFLLKNRFISNFKILGLNSEGEKTILYGNDIFKENVIKYPQDLKKDDFLIIVNPQNEAIAIARALTNTQELLKLSQRGKIALNLVDKGYYLRKRQ
jgi:ribosome biogenesis protein Nip4